MQNIITHLQIEPAELYHSQRNKYLSSHQLIDFMKCPLLHHKKRMGIIEDQETASFLIGRAAHTRILEGSAAFALDFAVGGPINPTTGKPYGSLTKKFAEWKETQDKPVLTLEQAALIEQMASGVALNDIAVELLSWGLAEGVVRSKYCEVLSQIRIDWFHPEKGIVDLKTCDDLTWFEAEARRYRYHNQMAFYQAVLNQKAGELVPVHIIAVEKKEPFRCGVWRVSDDCLAAARQENEAAIGRLISCLHHNQWPTGYEQIRLLDTFF